MDEKRLYRLAYDGALIRWSKEDLKLDSGIGNRRIIKRKEEQAWCEFKLIEKIMIEKGYL